MATFDKSIKPTKLLWVDLEMTGLDSDNDVILEIAAEITDFNFKTLASYEACIKHSDDILANMNEWAAEQHAKSGLTERCRNEGKLETNVQRELISFIGKQFGDERAVLAGNSIHNDRIFIKKWWPDVDALLHYRMLDVTAFKILFQGKFGIEYEKPEVHRAYEDIQASIAELQFYLDWFEKCEK